jgi:hypothetical protein
MTTFTTYQLPKLWPITLHRPADGTLPSLRHNTQQFASPFSLNSQTLQWPGSVWGVEAGFPPIGREDVKRTLYAFITSLRGAGGRFIFPAYTCRYVPPAPLQAERVTLIAFTADTTHITADSTRYTADATRVQLETVFTVSTCPDALTIQGYLMHNSGRAPLQVGGFISWDEADATTGVFVHRHLHIVVDMTTTPTTGATTLTVEPAMRYLPTSATPMHVYAPSMVCRMVDDGQAVMRRAGSNVSFGFTGVESAPLRIQVDP